MKIDEVIIGGKNLLGDSYALTVTLKVFSDLITPNRGSANTNPGNINLVDVRGTLATVNNAGMAATHFSRIGLDPNVGWSSNTSDAQEYVAKIIPSVSQAKNETYSYVNLVSDPLTGHQIQAIEDTRTGDKIGLFILLNFLFRFTELGSSSTVYVNTVTLRSNYSTNMFYFAIPIHEWAQIKERMGMEKTIFLEIHELSKPITDALTYIETAENAMSNWNSKEVFNNCREAGKALDEEVKRKVGKDSFTATEKWAKAYANFESFSSLALHIEDLKKSTKYAPDEVAFSRADSVQMVLMTKSLANYASKLIEESGKKQL